MAENERTASARRRHQGMRVLKIALAQVRVTMGNKRANIAAIFDAIAVAAHQQCHMVVFPECSLAGWLSSAAAVCAESIPGPFTRRVSALARRLKLAVVVGMEERSEAGQIYNSAILIDQTGSLRMRHRKINELELATSIYSRGASLETTELWGRTVGLTICADSWVPEITDALYLLGARLIFSPGAWAVESGGETTNLSWIMETYRQRVGSRDLYIIAPNSVGPVTQGPWKGRILQGNSLVIGPGGKLLICGPTSQPALLCFTLS